MGIGGGLGIVDVGALLRLDRIGGIHGLAVLYASVGPRVVAL